MSAHRSSRPGQQAAGLQQRLALAGTALPGTLSAGVTAAVMARCLRMGPLRRGSGARRRRGRVWVICWRGRGRVRTSYDRSSVPVTNTLPSLTQGLPGCPSILAQETRPRLALPGWIMVGLGLGMVKRDFTPTESARSREHHK
jgi:hypothetical protein